MPMAFDGNSVSVEDIRKMGLVGAAYIRMSTELQTDSPMIQEQQIRDFAAYYGIPIARIFKDLGISGMTAEARTGFLELIREVEEKRNNFNIVFYLDESRWGRFVDSSDAQYYRSILERNNVICAACDQPLTLTKDLGTRIMTIVRDESASAYCKQLSAKVFQGQKAKILQGFRQGGIAGYGIQRMLLSETGEPKQILLPGQRKSLQTERVILVPGTEDEQATINWVYDRYLAGDSTKDIADQLNATGGRNVYGRPWSSGTIRELLTNEKYIGNNVYNRVSAKLKSKAKRNPESEWIRKDNAFTPIVDKEKFYAVQNLIRERNRKFSNDELLEMLKGLYREKGKLSALIIDETDNIPPSSLYRTRFGGLLRAYQLVGYTPDRDLRYILINQRLREIHSEITIDTIQKISSICGREIFVDKETALIEINDNLFISITINRCFCTSSGKRRWKIRFDTGLRPDITVAVRMCEDNANIHDYYIIPKYVYIDDKMNLYEINSDLLDTFRSTNLDKLFDMSININIDEASRHVEKQNFQYKNQ